MATRDGGARYDRSDQDGARLVFAYRVGGKDADDDGVSVRKNALDLRILINPRGLSRRASATGYALQVSADGTTGWTDLARITTATHYTHSGLQPETTRHYRVKATSAAGDSPWSAVASDTMLAAGAPEAPANFAAAPGVGSVTLSWTNPNNPTVTGYEYRQARSGEDFGPWQPVPNSHGGTVSHRVTGLDTAVSYSFRVRAVAGAVKEVPSKSVIVRANVRPSGLRAKGSVASETLTWDDLGDPSVTGWEYRYFVSNMWVPWTAIPNSNASAVTYTVRDLGPDQYTFEIRAVYPGDVKGQSASVQARARSSIAIAITSTPSANNIYKAGEKIRFQVDFDGAIIVTGTPQLTFRMGNWYPRAVSCAAHASDNDKLVCEYTVVAGDLDHNGVSGGGEPDQPAQ